MGTEEGKIIKLKNGKATVEMVVGSHCTSCRARHACSAMGGVVRQIEVPVKNGIRFGEQVTLSYNAKSRITSAGLVFLLPLVFLFIGYFVGVSIFKNEIAAILTTFGGLIIGFISLGILNRALAHNNKFLPTIIKVNH